MSITARCASSCIRPFRLTGTETSKHIIRSRLPAQSNFSNSLLSHRKISPLSHQHISLLSTRTRPRRSSTDSKMVNQNEFILTLSCPDRPGIVHAVTGFLAQHNLNIVDSQQFGDPTSKKFFMRVHFAPADVTDEAKIDANQLRNSFVEIAKPILISNLWPRPIRFPFTIFP
jgi:predicted amino acid-binding ACT domain protein